MHQLVSRAYLSSFRTYRLAEAPQAQEDPSRVDPPRFVRPIPRRRDTIVLTQTGVVVGFALFAAGYSSIRHFMVDGTIRLKRQGTAQSGKEEEHH